MRGPLRGTPGTTTNGPDRASWSCMRFCTACRSTPNRVKGNVSLPPNEKGHTPQESVQCLGRGQSARRGIRTRPADLGGLRSHQAGRRSVPATARSRPACRGSRSPLAHLRRLGSARTAWPSPRGWNSSSGVDLPSVADTNDHDDEFAVVNGVDVVVADADAVAVGGPDSLATPCGRGLSGSDLIESLMSFCSTRGSLPSDFAALVVILSSYPLMIVVHQCGPHRGSDCGPHSWTI